jgi:hypothetical protein
MTPDEERLQRYLEWKRAGDRKRAERRRRAIGYVVAPALCVFAVGVAAWLGWPSHDRSPAVSAVAPAIPRESAPRSPAPASETGTQVPEQPAVGLTEQPARPRPRTAPPVAARPRVGPGPSSRPVPDATVAAPAAPPDGDVGESDVAAAVAPTPAPVSPPEGLPAPAPPPSDVVSLPAPDPADAVQNPPVQDPTPPARAPSGSAVAVAPPTVRDRVASWAKGEVQEFRNGVKREIGEFRSGYETVRDVFRRRDARSPAR